MNHRILIAEDNTVSGIQLKSSLIELGYHVTLADNGKEALRYFKENPFSVVITDFAMPEMDGAEFITELNKSNYHPIIFVLTGFYDPSLIIKIMKLGVYDYLIKPPNIQDLAFKLKRAFELYEFRNLERISKAERQIRLEGHLDWVNWKERMSTEDNSKKAANQNLFESLQTSFSQGAGFGALISLLKIVSSSAIRDGSTYHIDSTLMDLINTNAEMAEKALSTFADIKKLIHSEPDLRILSCEDLHHEIKKILSEISSVFEVKKQYLKLNDIKNSLHNQSVSIDKSYFKFVIVELITNACKFSITKSDIVVITNIEYNNFTISIYNHPLENKDGTIGIPLQYENIIFEPFFRLTRNVYEEFKTLDFGLGLTKIETTLNKINAQIRIKNITDYTDMKGIPSQRVLCQISIPLI
jgi:CheY-like chemotaxis protein